MLGINLLAKLFGILTLVALLCLTLVYEQAIASERRNEEAISTEVLFPKADRCLACHNQLFSPAGDDISIGTAWQGSMMGNSAIDPYWQSAVRRETNDFPMAQAAIENECSKCHMPMAYQTLIAQSVLTPVFSQYHVTTANPSNGIALDGVACGLCHQITEQGLGRIDSFNGGFSIDFDTPWGQRPVFGPYQIKDGAKQVMHSASEMIPTQSTFMQESAFCATCHTLYTHALDAQSKVIATLPEQVPYLEWQHSAYREEKSCQDCHMQKIENPTPISSVLPESRPDFAQHLFRGSNFFMQSLFVRYGHELQARGVSSDFSMTTRQTLDYLQHRTARIQIEYQSHQDANLLARVIISHVAGHKLPTAYPSRRVWIHFWVQDQSSAQIIFESGAFKNNGTIRGNDNDEQPFRFEPHYQKIIKEDQVQIYEAILGGADGNVTTGLLTATYYLKDNRLLPAGFDNATASPDIQSKGRVQSDLDFRDGQDQIQFFIDTQGFTGPFVLQAELWYQPIAFRWAENLRVSETEQAERFLSYYQSMAPYSATILAQALLITP